MDAFEFYSRSQLPGGLGQELNGILRPDEILLAEVHASKGVGLALTDSRLIVVRAGLTQTGKPGQRRSAAIALQQIRGISLHLHGDDEDAQALLIDSVDARCPQWARKVPVMRSRFGDLFRFAGVFWARMAELGLTHSMFSGLSQADLICHNCGAPHSLYADSGNLPEAMLESLPKIVRPRRGKHAE